MKILCICQGGNVRSVCLKHTLNDMGHDALAVGYGENSRETISALVAWADKIVLLIPVFHDAISEAIATHGGKPVVYYNVGEDVWGNPFHPELKAKIRTMVKERRDFL